MSFVDGSSMSHADVAAVTGNNNGFGGNGGGRNVGLDLNIQNDMQRGFDQQALMGGINGLTSAVSNGFANAEISRCNGMTNVLQAMNANQAANTANVNALAMALTAPSK